MAVSGEREAKMSFDLQEIDPQYEERMRQAEADCDNGKGDARACHSLGEFLAVVKGDYNKAGKVYEENCRRYKYPLSCFGLGRLYLTGRGLPRNDTRSLNCFDKACDGGHTMACHHLGLMLLHGRDGTYEVDKDPVKARRMLQKACTDNIPDSCYALASHLLNPHVVDPKQRRDPVQARPLLDKACAASHAQSCHNLAVMYRKGDEGVPSDEDKFQHYKKVTEDLIRQMGLR